MNFSKLLTKSGLVLFAGLFAVGLTACSPPADEAPAAEEPVAVEPAAAADESFPVIGAAAASEGSEPKDGESPALGLPAKTDAEDVDLSIREAGEYGDDAMVAGLAPEGWSRTGNIEHYNVATLYTKINGRSELYMAYDVLGMSWISFDDDSDKSNFIDLFIYDMRSPTNAFGIYSVEREVDQPPVDAGREGYRTGSNYYFWKGNYYGYINASRENDANTKAGLGVVTALMQRLEDSGDPILGLELLPKDGLIHDTVQYFKADAMSLDFLNETFLGSYEVGDQRARAFVSMRADADEATSILEQFAVYGEDYADGAEKVTVAGLEVTVTDWGGGYFDAAFHIGPLVAGFSNVEGRDALTSALEGLIPKLQE